MTSPSRRYRYGPWHGGPDPLAPPVDLREAVEELGREVMEGSSPQAALRELLRRGLPGTRGLDDLLRQVWQRRSQLQRRNRLDGTLAEVQRLLERALRRERETLARDPSEDARFRELALDALPSDTGGAVRELASYDWRSTEARQDYAEIQQLLGNQVLQQRFRGLTDALRSTTPADVEQIRRMLTELNELLAAHTRGDPDTPQRFEQFMRRYGEYFPENPRTVEELVDLLAARAAAAQRLMNSLSAEQRAELAELMQQAFGDPRLAEQVALLDAQLQALRPDQDWTGRANFRGQQPLGLAEATAALEELGELDRLAEQLSQAYPGARLEDVDLDTLTQHLGDQARVDLQRLAELERELQRQGVLERAPEGGLRLTPKALRRLGETALRAVVDQLRSPRGERDAARAGAAGEPTGTSRPWQFGDSEPWDVARTVANGVLRRAATGGKGPLLVVEDVEVLETEQRARAAVALCVDTSWSMVQDGRWVPMKRTALALHHLVRTRYRSDALELITFGRYASTVDIGELTALEGAWEQGTNLHHALLLAGRHLRRHPQAQPVVLVITDGEPTAHLEADAEAVFNYPPLPETVQRTLAEVDALARMGASVTVFMLGDDPRLAAFVDLIARRGRGRVVAPTLDGLGAAVISDYLRSRRR